MSDTTTTTEDRKLAAMTLPVNLFAVFTQAKRARLLKGMDVDDTDNASEFDTAINNALNRELITDYIIRGLAADGYEYDPTSDAVRSRITEQMKEFASANPKNAGESSDAYKARYKTWKSAQDKLKTANEKVQTLSAVMAFEKGISLMAMAKTPQEKEEAAAEMLRFITQLQSAPPVPTTRTRKPKIS